MITPNTHQIKYLADCREHIDTVTQWYWEEWHRDTEGWSFEETRHIVANHNCHKDKLNINIVALTDDNMPMGTIQLMDDEFLPEWENKGPWLGGLYIAPEYRHTGLAYRLGYTMITKAMNMGFEEIYMFTDTIHRLPQRHHFNKMGETVYGGKPVKVYRKELFGL